MSQSVINYLKTLPLFAGVTSAELEILYETMGLVQHGTAGHVIFDVGDKPDGAYVVAKGACALTVPVEGADDKEVARLGKGAVVGELCLIRAARRTLRLTVVEPADIIEINGPAFHRLRESGDAGAYKLLRNIGLMMCERLRDTNELLALEWRGETREAPVIAAPAKESAWQRLKRLLGGGS